MLTYKFIYKPIKSSLKFKYNCLDEIYYKNLCISLEKIQHTTLKENIKHQFIKINNEIYEYLKYFKLEPQNFKDFIPNNYLILNYINSLNTYIDINFIEFLKSKYTYKNSFILNNYIMLNYNKKLLLAFKSIGITLYQLNLYKILDNFILSDYMMSNHIKKPLYIDENMKYSLETFNLYKIFNNYISDNYIMSKYNKNLLAYKDKSINLSLLFLYKDIDLNIYTFLKNKTRKYILNSDNIIDFNQSLKSLYNDFKYNYFKKYMHLVDNVNILSLIKRTTINVNASVISSYGFLNKQNVKASINNNIIKLYKYFKDMKISNILYLSKKITERILLVQPQIVNIHTLIHEIQLPDKDVLEFIINKNKKIINHNSKFCTNLNLRSGFYLDERLVKYINRIILKEKLEKYINRDTIKYLKINNIIYSMSNFKNIIMLKKYESTISLSSIIKDFDLFTITSVAYEQRVLDLNDMYELKLWQRFWFLYADGETDNLIIPNTDYCYEDNPIDNINKHPIQMGKDLGIGEIPLSINIMIEMINILIFMWCKFYRAFWGYTGTQAVSGIILNVFEWISLETSIIHQNKKESKQHYSRCYRWMRWEAEKIILKSRNDMELRGNYYIELLIEEMINYMLYHHFDIMPIFKDISKIDEWRSLFNDTKDNWVLDKIKGLRNKILN